MELLREYDYFSNSNEVDVIGIDLTETMEDWDIPKEPIRIMAWTPNEPWIPILKQGTLFLGVVDNPGVKKVIYRIKGNVKYKQNGISTFGWWRPTELPIPLDSIPGTLEVKVITENKSVELAWLLTPDPEHQKIFRNLNYKEIIIG